MDRLRILADALSRPRNRQAPRHADGAGEEGTSPVSNPSKPDRLQADAQAQSLRPISIDDPNSAWPLADADINAALDSARPAAEGVTDPVAAIGYRVLLFTHTGLDIVPPPLSVWFLDRQDADAVARLSSGDFDAVATLHYDGRGEPRLIGFEGDPARRDMLIHATLAERQANPLGAGPDAPRPDAVGPKTVASARAAFDGDDAIRISGAQVWRQVG